MQIFQSLIGKKMCMIFLSYTCQKTLSLKTTHQCFFHKIFQCSVISSEFSRVIFCVIFLSIFVYGNVVEKKGGGVSNFYYNFRFNYLLRCSFCRQMLGVGNTGARPRLLASNAFLHTTIFNFYLFTSSSLALAEVVMKYLFDYFWKQTSPFSKFCVNCLLRFYFIYCNNCFLSDVIGAC